jgi:hypothetical protein
VKIQMLGDSILATKLKSESQGEYETPGDEPTSEYKVDHAGPESGVTKGMVIYLKPGTYENIQVGDQIYTFLTQDDVFAIGDDNGK